MRKQTQRQTRHNIRNTRNSQRRPPKNTNNVQGKPKFCPTKRIPKRSHQNESSTNPKRKQKNQLQNNQQRLPIP